MGVDNKTTDLQSAARELSESFVRLIEALARQDAVKYLQEQVACVETKKDSVTLMRMPAVLDRSGYSRTSLYEAMASGEFPRPRKRGGQALWVESEVDAALKRQAESLPMKGAGVGGRGPRQKKNPVTRSSKSPAGC